MAGFKKPNLEL
jgi:hypothetical protein